MSNRFLLVRYFYLIVADIQDLNGCVGWITALN